MDHNVSILTTVLAAFQQDRRALPVDDAANVAAAG
jgi:hypothetical protein